MRGTLATVAVSLAILLFVGFYTGNQSRRTTAEFSRAVDELDTLVRAGKWENAEEGLKNLQQAWEERSELLQTWVNHADVDTVSLAFRELSCALEMHEAFYAMTSMEELREGISHIYHRDSFALKNIF